MPEPRDKHPGPCNEWCREHGCSNQPPTIHEYTPPQWYAENDTILPPPDNTPGQIQVTRPPEPPEMQGLRNIVTQDVQDRYDRIMQRYGVTVDDT